MKKTYGEAVPTSAWADEKELSIVTCEVHPIVGDEHGSSIGAQIDNLLAEYAKPERTGQVQDITLHLFRDQLDAVHGYYRGQ